MRYTLERSLSPKLEDGNAPGEAFLGVCGPSDFGQCPWQILGQHAFVTGQSAHLRGLQVRGNTLMIETTAPVQDIASRLALPFFSAVPIGTPLSGFDPQQHPIPSAGPYYVSYQNIGWQTVLRRNPNYQGPRPHRLDAIVYDVGIDTGPAANRIKAGALDYESESYPDYGALAAGRQALVCVDPDPQPGLARDEHLAGIVRSPVGAEGCRPGRRPPRDRCAERRRRRKPLPPNRAAHSAAAASDIAHSRGSGTCASAAPRPAPERDAAGRGAIQRPLQAIREPHPR
jgi:hypothetical protein